MEAVSGAERVTIIGSFISPYVRKVLAALHLKGIAYEIDPIVPFFGNDEFSRLSPLRRIPVLIDGDVTLCDSTVICEYLEERTPEPALLPRTARDRARSRWLEEFADTRLGDVLIWALFNQRVIRRGIWGEAADEAIVARALNEDIPECLDYLERELPADGFLFGALGVADLALAAPFRNAAFARFQIDAARWPKSAAFVARVLEHDAVARLRGFEEASLRTPPANVRDALATLGAPISARSWGEQKPRRGVMRI
ncbi:MAG TPA: glutathione S-transferase family protein [Myxococcota bacterium]